MSLLVSPITSAVCSVRTGTPDTRDRLFHNGISLNFASNFHYTKVSGAVPTVAALTSLFTFTGGNQSMYMGAGGLLIASATNTPRIEYDAGGSCLGLLMEAARTNLGLYSADGTNAAWTKTNCTAAKTATGPDGVANSATTVTSTAGNATILQTVTSASATRAYAIWLKRRTGTGNIDLTLDGGTGWTTKTITSTWARYFITQAGVTNPNFGIRIVTNGDAVDFFGSQLESAAFSSSDIPTTTVSVARTADTCIRTLSTEFSATAGTVVVAGRASRGQDASVPQRVWVLHDGTDNNRTHLARPAASDLARIAVSTAAVAQAVLDGTFTNSALFKSAAAWAANDFAHSFNGAAVLTDAAGTVPTTPTLEFGLTSIQQMNGHIRTFDYYPTRMINADLVRLSGA